MDKTPQFRDESRSESGKLLALLVVFLVGCGCWVSVWKRGMMASRNTGGQPSDVNSHAENVAALNNGPL